MSWLVPSDQQQLCSIKLLLCTQYCMLTITVTTAWQNEVDISNLLVVALHKLNCVTKGLAVWVGTVHDLLSFRQVKVTV